MNEQTKEKPADSDNLNSLVRHLDDGGQIYGGCGQWVMKEREDLYFLCCENEGCCDTQFDRNELVDYLNGQDWNMLPNDKVSLRGSQKEQA